MSEVRGWSGGAARASRFARLSHFFSSERPEERGTFRAGDLRTFKSTFERWCRILDRRASFWMNRHLPEPYFSTPLRRASSSSEDHCERCEGSQEVSASDVPWVTRRRFVGRSRREGRGAGAEGLGRTARAGRHRETVRERTLVFGAPIAKLTASTVSQAQRECLVERLGDVRRRRKLLDFAIWGVTDWRNGLISDDWPDDSQTRRHL